MQVADFDFHIRGIKSCEGGKISALAAAYLEQQAKFLPFAAHCLGDQTLHELYAAKFRRLLLTYAEQLTTQHRWQVAPGDQKFAADFFAKQVAALYLGQLDDLQAQNKTAALTCLELIFDDMIPDLLSHIQNADIARA